MAVLFLIMFLFAFIEVAASVSLHKKLPPFNEISPNEIPSPLITNCTESVCTGPLAPIYCHGDITSTSWRFGLYSVCPGPKLRFDAETVVRNFQNLTYPIRRNVFVEFCENNFEHVSYLEQVDPVDWNPRPSFIDKVQDVKHRNLSDAINRRWKSLSRRFSRDVIDNSSFFPVVPVPNTFIVPGGFFQTYFYWDTFWINKGLLHSGMFRTVRGILDNFATLIERNGFIPNGGELHLSRRSQPPLFIHMVSEYYEASKDMDSVRRWMSAMDREMTFWMHNRTERITKSERTFQLFVYRASSNCPRPENFISDYKLGLSTNDPQRVWRGMASACETGWDFSSRWFSHQGAEAYAKKTVRTEKIAPVDLNVFMARNAYFMANFKKLLKEPSEAKRYVTLYDSIKSTINSLMWNSTYGIWFDINTDTMDHRTDFYPSNFYPLLLNITSPSVIESVVRYLRKVDILRYPGGVPSTLPIASQEQWDFPNVWAPNQYLFIISLLSTERSELVQIGYDQASKFVNEVYKGLFEPSKGEKGGIWEKYDARSEGKAGSGGEYPVQEGFGWTNGAAIDLIIRLAAFKSAQNANWFVLPSFGGSPHVFIVLGVLLFLLTLATWFSCCGGVLGRMSCRKSNEEMRNDGSSRVPLLGSGDLESD